MHMYSFDRVNIPISIAYDLSLCNSGDYRNIQRSSFYFQCTHRKRIFCVFFLVFRLIIRILGNKTAFLIQSTRVDSDIKKNGLFTHENAGRAHYTCRDRFRSLPLFDGYMRLSPENCIIKINNTGFISPKTREKNLTYLNVLRAGSFLDSKNDCGNQCRAMVDFLRGKSVAFRGEKTKVQAEETSASPAAGRAVAIRGASDKVAAMRGTNR